MQQHRPLLAAGGAPPASAAPPAPIEVLPGVPFDGPQPPTGDCEPGSGRSFLASDDDSDEDAEAEPEAGDAQEQEAIQSPPSASPPTPSTATATTALVGAAAAALELARRECCARLCLRAPAPASSSTGATSSATNSAGIAPRAGLMDLLASLAAMSKPERKVCMFTALSISSLAKPRPQRAPRPRAEDVRARNRFTYWLPLVGEACRAAFTAAFGVSHCSLSRYRRQVEAQRRLAPAPHGNARNANAKVLDDERLARWLRALAEQEGAPVTRRVRVRRTERGRRTSRMEEQRHVELPARYTWETLLRAFETAHPLPGAGGGGGEGEGSRHALRPSLASFRRILSAKCPEIRLRSAAASVNTKPPSRRL